jgi:hypothetical protein
MKKIKRFLSILFRICMHARMHTISAFFFFLVFGQQSQTCCTGMIVVTFDFRVGPMGYFHRPANMTLSQGDDVVPSVPFHALPSCISLVCD